MKDVFAAPEGANSCESELGGVCRKNAGKCYKSNEEVSNSGNCIDPTNQVCCIPGMFIFCYTNICINV